MTVVDVATVARPNGAAGPIILVPPPDARPGPPVDRQTPDEIPPSPVTDVGVGSGIRYLRNFRRTEWRAFDPAEYAALKAEARRLVEETTDSQYAIAQRLDIAANTLSKWKCAENWQRPKGAPVQRIIASRTPRPRQRQGRSRQMIGRLYRVFEQQAADLEARAAKGGSTDEKQARALSALAKTLETLIALDRDDGAKKPESVNRGDYKAELARQLSRWAEEGEEQGDRA